MEVSEDRTSEDRLLVTAFLDGRGENPFRQLYRAHTPRMFRLAKRLIGSSGVQAEDVVQEAWIRGVSALQKFEWRSSLASWLGGIVVNVVRETGRSTRRDEEAAKCDPEGSALAPLHHDESLTALTLAEAIRGLPEGYRSVLTLHDVGGFTHGEIAVMLDIDIGTSKSQLARARQRLRERIGRIHSDEGE